MLLADRNPDDYERSVETLTPRNIFENMLEKFLEDEATSPDVGDSMSPQSTEAT
jgi:hypothetical protein